MQRIPFEVRRSLSSASILLRLEARVARPKPEHRGQSESIVWRPPTPSRKPKAGYGGRASGSKSDCLQLGTERTRLLDPLALLGRRRAWPRRLLCLRPPPAFPLRREKANARITRVRLVEGDTSAAPVKLLQAPVAHDKVRGGVRCAPRLAADAYHVQELHARRTVPLFVAFRYCVSLSVGNVQARGMKPVLAAFASQVDLILLGWLAADAVDGVLLVLLDLTRLAQPRSYPLAVVRIDSGTMQVPFVIALVCGARDILILKLRVGVVAELAVDPRQRPMLNRRVVRQVMRPLAVLLAPESGLPTEAPACGQSTAQMVASLALPDKATDRRPLASTALKRALDLLASLHGGQHVAQGLVPRG
eukprot:scaffold300_cov258-Pinguiococcus_pyrenoidosus.AAC.8